MRPKSLILLVLAIGCGLVASVGISQVIEKQKNGGEKIEMEDIYVAQQDIEWGVLITPELLKQEAWPKDKIPHGAIRDLVEVEERRAKTAIYTDEPVLDAKLFRANESPIASNKIPAGYRVQAVKVDASATGGNLIVPGDRVDVLIFVGNRAVQNGMVEARTILQDIKVFAIDNIYNAEQAIGDQTGASIAGKTIGLLVTPDQAEKLMLAEQLGEIELTIRGPEDDEMVNTIGASIAGLFQTQKADRVAEGSATVEEPAEGGMWSWLASQESETTAETESPAVEDETIWTMTLMRGPDTSYARFRDGELLEEIVKSTPSSEPKPLGLGPEGTEESPTLPAPTLEAPGGQETPEIPDLDLLFGSMS